MKSAISILLSICLVTGLFYPVPIYAVSVQTEIEFFADCLKKLGLFEGTDKGYELDRNSTRVESAVMLTRLLGKEEEALSLRLTHPFTDVPVWANPYIGYLYQKRLTKGIGNNLFGSDQLTTPVQYAAFILRSLGYTEEKGDFTYFQALEKILELGVLERSEAEDIDKDKLLTRGEMVQFSYKALWCHAKQSDDRLVDRLINYGAVSELCVNALGKPKFPSDISVFNNRYIVKTQVQLDELIKWALFSRMDHLLINPLGYTGDIHQDANDSLKKNDSFAGMYNGADFKWLTDTKGSMIQYEITIRYTMSSFEKQELLRHACRVIASEIQSGMTDMEKELVIHDYVVNRTVYGYSEHAYDAYGALIQKESVCQGYSRAMLLLLSLSGVYCMEVVGTDEDTSHSWNIVRLDDEYYHVDASFDDPIGVKNVLRHYYFNVTDKDLESYRVWERSNYPVCASEKYNYYNITGTTVKDRVELLERIAMGFSEGKRTFEYRLTNYDKEDYTPEGMREFIHELSSKIKGNILSYSWVPYDKMGVVHITLK